MLLYNFKHVNSVRSVFFIAILTEPISHIKKWALSLDKAHSQHKHKIKHDKTTMQSHLSMSGRHTYYLMDIHIYIDSFRRIVSL